MLISSAAGVRIMDSEIGREKVYWLVVELRQKASARTVLYFFIYVLVAMNAAAEARFCLDDELRLDIVPEHSLHLAVAFGAEIVLRHEVVFFKRHVVGPGAAEATPVLLAESARARTGPNLLVEVTDFRFDFANLIRRLRDNCNDIFVAQHAPHATPAGPTALVVA